MNYYLARIKVGMNGDFTVLIKSDTMYNAFIILEREYSKEDGYRYEIMRTLE